MYRKKGEILRERHTQCPHNNAMPILKHHSLSNTEEFHALHLLQVSKESTNHILAPRHNLVDAGPPALQPSETNIGLHTRILKAFPGQLLRHSIL
jgi:hypothetical protein